MKLMNAIKDIFFNTNICILGVDGTGKSSVINKLQEDLGKDVEVQYMGSRDYMTTNMIKIESSGNEATSNTILNILYLLIEMWIRVSRHWGKGKTIIFDRYFWDRYLSLKGVKRIIGKIIFRHLFPKPQYVIYLYCDVEVSLKRKDDIIDVEQFRQTKEEFDREFLYDKGICKINTGTNNIQEVSNLILGHIRLGDN